MAIIYAIILIISDLLLMQFENIYYGHEGKEKASFDDKMFKGKSGGFQ